MLYIKLFIIVYLLITLGFYYKIYMSKSNKEYVQKTIKELARLHGVSEETINLYFFKTGFIQCLTWPLLLIKYCIYKRRTV